MLEQDLKAAIEKNLSAEVGTRLQERLAKVDSLERSLKVEESHHAETQAKLKRAQEDLAAHKVLADRESTVAKREAEVLARETKQEVLAEKLNGANARAQAVFDLASMAFRNPKYVRSEYANESRNVPSQYGGTTMVTDNSNKTVTEEQQ